MQIWPGDAYPLGATYDGSGTNFSIFSEAADAVELCLFDPGDPGGTTGDTTEQRITLTEVDGFCWHAYVPGVGPGTRYGFRVHGPWDPSVGAAVQPGEAAARPLRQGHRRRGRLGPVLLRLPLRRPRRAQRRGQRPARPEGGGAQPVLRLGQRPPAGDPDARDRPLRAAREGLDRPPPRGARGAPGHLRRARPPRGHRAPPGARRHRGRAPAGAPVRARRPPHRPGPPQLLGLQLDRLLRPPQRLRLGGRRRRAGAGVQDHGQAPARGGHRGHPRRRLQPHRRGQPPRTDALVQGPRQPARTTASWPTTRATTWTTRAPATP